MTVVSPLHRHYSPAHLDHVAAQMRQLGAPRLRGYHDATSGCWLLAEGTHRIRAAKLLGLAPVLIPVPWWRSQAALDRARFAAAEYGYLFPVVKVA
jgi:hypothetical protein